MSSSEAPDQDQSFTTVSASPSDQKPMDRSESDSPVPTAEPEVEDDYDPEADYEPAPNEHRLEPSTKEDEDEYNPEASIAAYDPAGNPSKLDPSKLEPPKLDAFKLEGSKLEGSKLKPPLPASLPKIPAGLPPKPPVRPPPSDDPGSSYKPRPHSKSNSTNALAQAYEEIMEAESNKDPNFTNLPLSDQMPIIIKHLGQRNFRLVTGTSYSDVGPMNYDQVYSYNKPYKNLKDPVPLIPVNEFCRRPDITAPMSSNEEFAYDEFIKRESQYMESQNWDEFPDKLRLFIGNLPANTISKQDLFRIFFQYGEVIQIAIKAGYGFAQFRTAEACYDCIKGELNVPLHNKIMRLDASKPQKLKKPEYGNSRGGRERGGNDNKRQRRNVPECQIYTTGKSSVFFVRKVKKCIQDAHITNEIEDVTHREISEVIGEAAYSGVLGTCVIKEHKCDVQTFETTPDGGIKFDEYSDIEPEVAAELLQKAKANKYGGQIPYQGDQYDNQYNNFNQGPYNNYSGQEGPGPGEYGGPAGKYGGYGADKRRDNRGGRGRFNDRSSYIPGGQNDSYGKMYGNQDPNMYGSPQPQTFSNPGYSPNVPNQQNFGNYGSYGGQYTPQVPNQLPPVGDQSGLIQTLQSMDPASMQNMISLLQQQQQPQSQFQPQPQGHQPQGYQPQGHQGPQGGQGGYGQKGYHGKGNQGQKGYQGLGGRDRNRRGNNQNQPIDYGSGGSSGPSNPPGPNSQVSSLLSQLQAHNNTQAQNNQAQNNNQPQQSQDSSSTQSLMDTLARLSRK